jgi:hypothetical protein
MNGMRKVFCFLMAMMLAAFALPGFAASTTKFFTASGPAVVPIGITSGIQFTFLNATPPPGVSTINSVLITPPTNVSINCNSITPGTGVLYSDGVSCVVTNFPGIKTGKTGTFTFTTNNSATSCAAGQWNSAANAGNSFPQGDVFAPSYLGANQPSSGVGCDGSLGCQNPGAPTNPAAQFGDGTVVGYRGLNKDGSTCNNVFFDLTDFIISNSQNQVHYQWDNSAQPHAVFVYSVHWSPAYVDPVTGLPKPTQVAWNLTGPPQYVDAHACLSAILPAPYGTLADGIDAVTGSITVNTTAPLPAVPFPIVIGTERMDVTAVGATWAVTRHTGGTLAAAHTAGDSVMSTPLPLDASGNLMQMCIVSKDIKVVTPDQCSSLPNPNLPNPPPACVQVDTLIIDQGDGWTSDP